MRIVVYAHSLKDAGGRSVGINLARSLPRVGVEHEFLVVVPAGRGYRSAAGAPNLSFVDAPNLGRFRRTWWEIWGARRLARKWSADWVLALGNVPLLGGAKRKAVLLHDPHLFYPMDQLSHLSRKVMIRKRFARAFLALSIRRQAVSFVQTSVAAKRVTKMYRIKSDDVVVIPNALSSAIRINIGAKNSEPLGLADAGFRFLTLTKYAGRKGLDRLVAMFDHHRAILKDVVRIFTIDAVAHAGAKRLMSRVASAGLGGQVINLRPVDQRRLAQLYGEVDAVVLPSLLKSFSGVYVEAMNLGVPIVTSDRDFARVVCGDAALYVDPGCVSGFLAALCDAPHRVTNDQTAGAMEVEDDPTRHRPGIRCGATGDLQETSQLSAQCHLPGPHGPRAVRGPRG